MNAGDEPGIAEASETSPEFGLALRTLLLDAMAAEVCNAFAQAGIDTILMKGPVAAAWLYPKGALRPYGDIDLLVDPTRTDEVPAVLARLGFVAHFAHELEPGSPWNATIWRRNRFESLDLHHALVGPTRPVEDVWRALRAQTAELMVAGSAVRAENTISCALHAAMHVAHHGIDEPRPIEDARRAIERLTPAEWHDVRELAHRIGAEDALAVGLRLVPTGLPVADELGLTSHASRELQLRASSREEGEFALTLERWIRERGLRRKLVYLWLHAFPAPERMRVAYPLAGKVPPFGLLAAYAWRLYRRAGFALRGIRVWLLAHRSARDRTGK